MAVLRSLLAGLLVLGGAAACPGEAQAVYRGSVRVYEGALSPFPLPANAGCYVERMVLVQHRRNETIAGMDGVVVIDGGKRAGQAVGELSWARGTGINRPTRDDLGIEFKLDRSGLKDGQKVRYQVTAIVEGGSIKGFRTDASPWYRTTVSSHC